MYRDDLYRAKQYQNNQRPAYNSPNNTPVVQKQAGSSPLSDFAQAYAQSQDPTSPFQFGRNARKIYDNAMARQHDGWYGNSFNSQSLGNKTLSDRAVQQAIDPKLYSTQSGTQILNQGNNMVNGANAITSGGGNLAGGLNLASNSVNGGTLASGIASGSQAIGASTAGLGTGIAADTALGANTAAIAGGAAEGATIGAGSAAATEGAAAAGSAATPALAAAAPYALGALGVYGLGRWLDWW